MLVCSSVTVCQLCVVCCDSKKKKHILFPSPNTLFHLQFLLVSINFYYYILHIQVEGGHEKQTAEP